MPIGLLLRPNITKRADRGYWNLRFEMAEAALEKLGEPPPDVTELRKRTGALETLRAQGKDLPVAALIREGETIEESILVPSFT